MRECANLVSILLATALSLLRSTEIHATESGIPMEDQSCPSGACESSQRETRASAMLQVRKHRIERSVIRDVGPEVVKQWKQRKPALLDVSRKRAIQPEEKVVDFEEARERLKQLTQKRQNEEEAKMAVEQKLSASTEMAIPEESQSPQGQNKSEIPVEVNDGIVRKEFGVPVQRKAGETQKELVISENDEAQNSSVLSDQKTQGNVSVETTEDEQTQDAPAEKTEHEQSLEVHEEPAPDDGKSEYNTSQQGAPADKTEDGQSGEIQKESAEHSLSKEEQIRQIFEEKPPGVKEPTATGEFKENDKGEDALEQDIEEHDKDSSNDTLGEESTVDPQKPMKVEQEIRDHDNGLSHVVPAEESQEATFADEHEDEEIQGPLSRELDMKREAAMKDDVSQVTESLSKDALKQEGYKRQKQKSRPDHIHNHSLFKDSDEQNSRPEVDEYENETVTTPREKASKVVPEIGTHAHLMTRGSSTAPMPVEVPVNASGENRRSLVKAAVARQRKSNSTRTSVRAEMAWRALYMEVGDEEEQNQQDPDVPDETFDTNLISGSTASLSDAGYKSVASLCCPLEMVVFTHRLVSQLGFVICNDGSEEGMVAWYYCLNQTRTFAELVEDVISGAEGDCAWVGTETFCPPLSSNCPYFPDETAHRRRTCAYRKVANTTTTTGPPGITTTTEAEFQCDPAAATSLDFAGSTVGLNSLAGDGEMTFQGIATYQGSSIDLVVTAPGSYTPMDSSENGLHGSVGQINLRSGTSAEFTFAFEEHATGDRVKLPEFYFTFLGIDQSDTKHRERIYVEGFARDVEEDVKDFETEVLTDGRTLYKSLKSGFAGDEPANPLNLTVVANPIDPTETIDQSKRSVMLVFRNTSQFSVTFEVTEREATTPMGRNFMFAGESSLLDNC